MRRQVPATVALVVVVVLAGCAGGIGGGDASTTTATTTQTPTGTPTPTDTPTATTTAEPTPTPTPTYVAPITPNRPTQAADASNNHIKSGSFINKTPAENGSGYTDFDVQIRANTSIRDPPEVRENHGDVEGEPYAVVIVNGHLVERSPYFELTDDGTFNISVHPGGLRQAGVEPGTLDVRVLLMDQDSSRDDLYGTWSGTVEYAG